MRRILTLLLAVLGLVVSHAAWAAPSLVDQARAYAAAHNLPIREVKLDNVPGREGMVRIFVPVTDQTHADFVQRFTGSGAIIRQPGNDLEHVHLALQPNDVMQYSQLQGGGQVLPPAHGGLYIALSLTPEQKAYFKANAPNAPRANVAGRSTGCMYWLSSGSTAPDAPLGHNFGIKRSSAPSNLVKKLIHAGDEGVIVGVPITENNQQTQNLRGQVVNYENAINQAEAQIANYENQGGNGRLKLFQQQSGPYREAIGKADAAIGARQHQPAIVQGLQARRTEIQGRLDALQAQHEQPYHARIQQLEGTIAQTAQRLAQTQTARDQGVKAAAEVLAAREHEHAELLRLAPKGANANRFELKLFEFEQAISTTRAQIQQQHVAREANRAQWHAQVKTAEDQLKEMGKVAPPAQAGAPNANAYNARIQQLDQQVAQHEVNIANPGYNAQQKAPWQATVGQLTTVRAELQKLGPERYDVNVDQRINQAAQQIMNARVQLNTLDQQEAQAVAPLNQQIEHLQASRDAIAQKGANAYHPEFDQELARLNQQIANHEVTLAAQAHMPANAAQAVQTRAALATFVEAKQQLLAQNALEYNPQYQARLTQLDQQVHNLESQIQQYANVPNQVNNVAQWRAQLAPLQQQKADLVKLGAGNFNPQYDQRVQQVDQQIAGLENNINAYAAQPNYAGNRAQWQAQLDPLKEIKAHLAAVGPHGYNPEFEQKLTATSQALTQAKTNLQTQTTNLDAQLHAVKQEAKLADTLKAELVKHGALKYNPHYEQRLTQLDQQNSQLENNIRSPQYNDQQKAQWRAQLDANNKLREELTAKGPENYSQFEPQIQALRQQIEQHRVALAPLKQQLDLADAAANAGKELEAKFAAITDQALMGAPPGGGAAEAVHHPAGAAAAPAH